MSLFANEPICVDPFLPKHRALLHKEIYKNRLVRKKRHEKTSLFCQKKPAKTDFFAKRAVQKYALARDQQK